MRQFTMVDCSRGAPMGRHSSILDTAPRSVRLFKVRVDSGGYDDGGAYWGFGLQLWCAMDADGNCQFTRASNRAAAADNIGIDDDSLIIPTRKERKARADRLKVFAERAQ